MADPLLDVREVSVKYGHVRAVSGVSLTVALGEVVAVLGSNGAGKTSLLRGISGLVPLDGGSVAIDGIVVSGRHAHHVARSGLAHVPEGRGVGRSLTVTENLRTGAVRMARAEMRDRIDDMFDLFPSLARRRGVAAGLLSGGEQQMLAIARGLVARPRIMALDEPSMGLAPVVVHQVKGALMAASGMGVAILLIEQNAALALAISSRVLLLKQGTIVNECTPEDLRAADSVLTAYLQ